MYHKFIVTQGRLKLGVVDQHKELAKDHSTTQGGGWWHRDAAQQTILLYGESLLFGPVKKILLKKIIAEGLHDYPEYTFYYSRSRSLETAISQGEKL